MSKEAEILRKTHYGLNIYSHILRIEHPNELVIRLSGNECCPTKNPFNQNKQTLKLINKNGVFMYYDLEIPNFKGTPFDFAELHYNLSGNMLFEKLNEELQLRMNEQHHVYSATSFPYKHKMSTVKPTVRIPEFSYFKAPVSNIYPKETLSLVEVYELIKSTQNTAITKQLRSITNKNEARKFKASKFDYVTFSGTFEKRNDNSLLSHSGLMTIDFDHIPNLKKFKNQLLHDEYFETELLFISPSGDGLKWIILIDLNEATHQNFFNAIVNYMKAVYQQEIDKSGKDISRACFLSSDPEAFIHPKYVQQ